MTQKIRHQDKYYRAVPWFGEGSCEGCAFHEQRPCPNTDGIHKGQCDDGGKFMGFVFIRPSKEAMAEYITKKLEGEPNG